MRNLIKITLFILTAIITMSASCSKSDEVKPVPVNSATPKDNTWKVNDVLYTASQYGRGWASSDFSPAFGLTDANTDTKGTKIIQIIFLEKPKKSGTYSIEEFSDIKLNAVRSNKISGSKVALEITDNAGNIAIYQSKAGNGGVVEIEVTNGKFKAKFNNITLVDPLMSTKKVIVSGTIVE